MKGEGGDGGREQEGGKGKFIPGLEIVDPPLACLSLSNNLLHPATVG